MQGGKWHERGTAGGYRASRQKILPTAPSLAAIQRLGESWAPGELMMVLDLHSPWLRGDEHVEIHLWEGRIKGLGENGEFRGNSGVDSTGTPLPLRSVNNLPFGKNGNAEKNIPIGESCGRWAEGLPDCRRREHWRFRTQTPAER